MASVSLDHHQLDLGMLDDDMEISSERGHDVGDYIEIDQDLDQHEDADFMIDDINAVEESQFPNDYVNDDLMSDDDPDTPILEDAVTMEDDTIVEDEELDDASTTEENKLDTTNVFNSGLDATASNQVPFSAVRDTASPTTTNVGHLQPAFNIVEETEHIPSAKRGAEEQLGELSTEEESIPIKDDNSTFEGLKGNAGSDSHVSPHLGSPKEELQESASPSVDVIGNSNPAISTESQEFPNPNTSVSDAVQLNPAIEATSHVPESTYAQDSHADVRSENDSPIHPVVVVWKDELCHLFQPSNSDPSETYFFSDSALCQRPLSELLRACKTFLGSDVPEDAQLVAYFQKLGLTVSEDMVDSPPTTLDDLLNLYALLTQQSEDYFETPLYIVLRTEFRFSSRLMYLHNAREQGKTLKDVEIIEATDYEASAGFEGEDDYVENNNPEENFYEGEYDEFDEQETQQDEATFQNFEPNDDIDPQPTDDNLTNVGEGQNGATFESVPPDGNEDAQSVINPLTNNAEGNKAELIAAGGATGTKPTKLSVPDDEDNKIDPNLANPSQENTKSQDVTLNLDLVTPPNYGVQKADGDGTIYRAYIDTVENDPNNVGAGVLGQDDDFTSYPEDVLDDLEEPAANNVDKNSASEVTRLHSNHLSENSVSEEENSVKLGTKEDIDDSISGQISNSQTELPASSRNDRFDEDELTFSEDELENVVEQDVLPKGLTKEKTHSPPAEAFLRSTDDVPSTSLPKSRKRSFGEHTELSLDDGVEQKKPRAG